MAGSNMVQSVLRAIDIMQSIARASDGLRLVDIEAECGLKKTTAHNLIRTLMARGFVEKDDRNRFLLGESILGLASIHSERRSLMAAEKLMWLMNAEYPDATLTFSELTPSSIVCRLRMSPDRPGEMQRPLNQSFAPYISQTAICLQATAVQAAALEDNYPFEEYGAGRWGSLAEFQKALREVQQKGSSHVKRGRRLVAAFPLPDNFTLGFCLDDPPTGLVRSISSDLPRRWDSLGQKLKGNLTRS